MAGYSKANYTDLSYLNGNTFSSISESGVAPNIQFGYEFNHWTALELGVIYAQKPKFTTTNSPGEHKIKSNIVYLDFKPRWFFYKNEWYLYSKIGIGYLVRDQLTINQSDAMNGGEFLLPVYGVGLGYRPTYHWQVEAGWMQTPANHTEKVPVTNFYGVGANYLF